MANIANEKIIEIVQSYGRVKNKGGRIDRTSLMLLKAYRQ